MYQEGLPDGPVGHQPANFVLVRIETSLMRDGQLDAMLVTGSDHVFGFPQR